MGVLSAVYSTWTGKKYKQIETRGGWFQCNATFIHEPSNHNPTISQHKHKHMCIIPHGLSIANHNPTISQHKHKHMCIIPHGLSIACALRDLRKLTVSVWISHAWHLDVLKCKVFWDSNGEIMYLFICSDFVTVNGYVPSILWTQISYVSLNHFCMKFGWINRWN